MEAIIKCSQNKMKTTVRASEENTEVAINTIRSKLEEAIKIGRKTAWRLSDTRPPRGMQREDLRNVAGPTDSNDGVPRAYAEIAGIKKDLLEEFNIRIRGT
jgi:hypothetical protein